jgi:two-component system nitrogen regulation sensor histidine kinase NtrY
MPSDPNAEHQPNEANSLSLSGHTRAHKNKKLRFERRIHLWLLGAAIAIITPSAILVFQHTGSISSVIIAAACMVAVLLVLANLFLEQLIRPLQTLANVVAALREDDFSFRARGAHRGDAVGDLAIEVNALAGTLQDQRSSAQDALTLLERVLTSMHSPVFAFYDAGHLRLLNTAARQSFPLGLPNPTGHTASELGLDELLEVPDQGLYPAVAPDTFTSNPTRWSVRRATFRLHGLPHTLLVLSDVAAVLREEERLAWQRLIRVLSHEINNSLTPIKSIAGSLRTRTIALNEDDRADFERGLSVIEERAASLNRFLQAYQRLTHLPAPNLRPTPVQDLVSRTAQLETRMPITIIPGPSATLLCDSDQIQQALINLLRNAADAALAPGAVARGHNPSVTLTWTIAQTDLRFFIADNGQGIQNPSNLFVPFYTTKPQGSGIGLVLAQQIAAAHHGSIALLSNPDHQGCTASLTLPFEIQSGPSEPA